jgi:glycosyltransferase involved in cell wall biosynthesis
MLKWAKFFSERGHNVHLLSYAPFLKNYDLGRINFHLLKKTFPINIWPLNTVLNLPLTIKQAKRIIKEIKPDVINAHYITSYGSIGIFSGFRPLVLTAWGSDILVTPRKFLPSKWAVKYFLKKADLITCDAEHMKKAMVKFGASADKVKIINFGIDTRLFSPGPKDEEIKNKLNLKDNKIIISLRGFESIYDIESLIKAIPIVMKKEKSIKLLLAGKGSQEKELRRIVEQLGLKERIIFLGAMENKELPRYLRTADVYVSSSLSDGGISSSTAEAMACKIPVVITDTGSNKDWVKNGENGFLVPVKSPEALAEKIIYLLNDENVRQKIGSAGRAVIEEKNDYYNEMEKIEKSYYELIKK